MLERYFVQVARFAAAASKAALSLAGMLLVFGGAWTTTPGTLPELEAAALLALVPP